MGGPPHQWAWQGVIKGRRAAGGNFHPSTSPPLEATQLPLPPTHVGSPCNVEAIRNFTHTPFVRYSISSTCGNSACLHGIIRGGVGLCAVCCYKVSTAVETPTSNTHTTDAACCRWPPCTCKRSGVRGGGMPEPFTEQYWDLHHILLQPPSHLARKVTAITGTGRCFMCSQLAHRASA